MTSTTYSDGTPAVNYHYGRTGQLISVSKGGRNIAYDHDDWGKVIGERYSGIIEYQLSRNHDELGRSAGYDLILNGSIVDQVSYSYGQSGRLDSVSDGNLTARYSYLTGSDLVSDIQMEDSVGRMLIDSTKQYDRIRRSTSVEHRTSQGIMISFAYDYNSVNQRIRLTREDGSFWQNEYDDKEQLNFGGKFSPSGKAVPGYGFGYEYDDIGNRRFMDRRSMPTDGSTAEQRSEYTANLLNQYEQRTVPGYVEILGKVDPRADLTVESIVDSTANATTQDSDSDNDVEQSGKNFRVSTPADNRNKSVDISITVAAEHEKLTEENGGINIYAFLENNGIDRIDYLGQEIVDTNTEETETNFQIIGQAGRILFLTHEGLVIDGSSVGYWPAGGEKEFWSIMPWNYYEGWIMTPDPGYKEGETRHYRVQLDDCEYDIDMFNECMKSKVPDENDQTYTDDYGMVYHYYPDGDYNLYFHNCKRWSNKAIRDCKRISRR